MKRMPYMILLPIALLGGCVTAEATAEERARCQEMEQRMGTDTTHDHGEIKGTGASPMNQSHRRCRQILAQPE